MNPEKNALAAQKRKEEILAKMVRIIDTAVSCHDTRGAAARARKSFTRADRIAYEDLRKRVDPIILANPGMSIYALAELAGVAPSTVARYRMRLRNMKDQSP